MDKTNFAPCTLHLAPYKYNTSQSSLSEKMNSSYTQVQPNTSFESLKGQTKKVDENPTTESIDHYTLCDVNLFHISVLS